MRLKTLMGEYPVTRQFLTRTGEFEFAEVKGSPASAFKRVVRNLEFDVAEMAIVTHLIALAHRKPYRLLPFVVLARFQHPYLVYCPEKKPGLKPEDLAGRKVGVRSYSVTTGAWIRCILAEDHGVDLSSVRWITFEEAHVAEFRDPPNVERAPAGKDLLGMLRAGELDAAIVGAIGQEPDLEPLIRDPEGAGRRWGERHGGIQLNHLVVVKDTVSKAKADEVYRLLIESKQAAGAAASALPHGVEANRRNLELAIDCAWRQNLIPRCYSVDELFDQ